MNREGKRVGSPLSSKTASTTVSELGTCRSRLCLVDSRVRSSADALEAGHPLVFHADPILDTTQSGTLERSEQGTFGLGPVIFHLPCLDSLERIRRQMRDHGVLSALNVHLHEVDLVDAELRANARKEPAPRDSLDTN